MNCENSISVFPKSIALKVNDWSFDAFANVYCTDYSCSNVTWHSEDPSIASVNSVTGYICANGVGTTRIYATLTYGTSEQLCDYLTVTVTKRIFVESVALNTNAITIEKCKNTSLWATVLPANATKTDVYWESSNTDVATVTNGTVTGISAGTAIITVKAADDLEKRASCVVTVTDKILVSSIKITTDKNVVDNTITAKKAAYLYATISPENATKKSVTWSSSNKNIATINSNSGLLSAQAPGTTIIRATAKDGSGVVGTYQITVLAIPVKSVCVCPKNKTIGLNETAKFYAVISPIEASNQSAIWTSSDTSVATVTTYTGIVTGVSDGTATITATTVDGEKTDSSTVTVDTRERVNIKKDYNSFYVEFSNNKIWKYVGIDISKRNDYYAPSQPPMLDEDNYSLLISAEKRYFDNSKQNFSIKEIAFLYLIDPLGIEYYIRSYNDFKVMSDVEFLFFKDNIYKEIFGIKPRLFRVLPTGTIDYYNYPDTASDDFRYSVYSYAELLFGSHVIIDALSIAGFFSNILKDIFGNISIGPVTIDEILSGIELFQALFFAGSVTNSMSDIASTFISTYASSSDFSTALDWLSTLLNILEYTKDLLSPPNPQDITIYDKLEAQDYSTRFILNGNELSMKDIISRTNHN